MKTLALDTSLAACSVAMAEDDTIIAREWIDLPRGHAERLFDLIAQVEEKAGLTIKDMDRLAVTVGPGTFTGLRVGLAAAKGLALAAGLPLLGVSTLQTVALNAAEEVSVRGGLLTVAFDARRDEVYHQTFDAVLKPVSAPAFETISEAAKAITRLTSDRLNEIVFLGTGAEILKSGSGGVGAVSKSAPQPDAGRLASFANGLQDISSYPALPLYLRAPDAKLPKKRLFQT